MKLIEHDFLSEFVQSIYTILTLSRLSNVCVFQLLLAVCLLTRPLVVYYCFFSTNGLCVYKELSILRRNYLNFSSFFEYNIYKNVETRDAKRVKKEVTGVLEVRACLAMGPTRAKPQQSVVAESAKRERVMT